MRIFITGATGVVGRRLIPSLLADGHQLTCVARSEEKRVSIEKLGAAAIQLDLFSPADASRALSGHDTLIHLATSIPSTARLMLPGAWRENDRLRREASNNLARAALQNGVGRYIQESFALIYADNGEDWIEEGHPVRVASHTRSVLEAENAVEAFTAKGGVGVALRFGLFYGPDSGQTLDSIRSVRGGIALMPGPEDGYLSSISHDDAARAVAAALGAGPGIYNVVEEEPLRKREYFASLASALGVDPPRLLPGWTRYLLGSVGETISRSLRISNQKFKSETGWKPEYPSAAHGWATVLAQADKD